MACCGKPLRERCPANRSLLRKSAGPPSRCALWWATFACIQERRLVRPEGIGPLSPQRISPLESRHRLFPSEGSPETFQPLLRIPVAQFDGAATQRNDLTAGGHDL